MLSAIRDSFLISENTPGYELKLRSALSDIWFQIFELALPLMQTKDRFDKRNKRLRLMMVYIHEHYAEKISVKILPVPLLPVNANVSDSFTTVCI